MAANLTPGYRRAEAAFRVASTLTEELAALQEMLREVPKHKGTDRLQADLKGRIRRARADLERENRESKEAGRSGRRIARQGVGRCVIVGAPNSGKSTLLAALTPAQPSIAPHPYTTHQALPGMMNFQELAVQLIDTPPISAERYQSEVQELVRSADLVLALCDCSHDSGLDELLALLETVRKSKSRWGKRSGFVRDDLGVTLTRSVVYYSRVSDTESMERAARFENSRQWEFDRLWMPRPTRVSNSTPSQTCLTIDEIKREIFERLELMRVFTREPDSGVIDPVPLALPIGATALDLARAIHHSLAEKFMSAKVITGGSSKAVVVGRDHVLQDGDVVEIRQTKAALTRRV